LTLLHRPWGSKKYCPGDGRADPKHNRPFYGESPLNKDFYTNLKAQAWWELRRRFEKSIAP
jgi:phage terminase large subunit